MICLAYSIITDCVACGLKVYRSSDMDIDLSEFSPLAVLAVLKFVYAGHISTIGDGLQDVLMLAERQAIVVLFLSLFRARYVCCYVRSLFDSDVTGLGCCLWFSSAMSISVTITSSFCVNT